MDTSKPTPHFLTSQWTMPTLLLTITIIYIIYHLTIIPSALPPGPTPHPLIGNALPPSTAQKPFLHFTQLSHTYGKICTFFLFRSPKIIISSPHTAHTLLTQRANNYSSRPRSVVFCEIYSKGMSIIVQPSGPSHSLRRKLLSHSLNMGRFLEYKSLQVAEASVFLAQLLQITDGREKGEEVQGEDWVSLIDRFTASMVFTIAYGRRIVSTNAEVVRKRREYTAFMTTLLVPGSYKAEIFPWLKYLPEILAPWKRKVREVGDQDRAFNRGLVESVKVDLKQSGGVGNGSMAEHLLAWQKEKGAELLGEEESERLIGAVPNSLFTAGSDTTSSTMQALIFALVTHPHILKTAQEEIDSVLGQRLASPTFEDLRDLPYISAMVTEILRWRPIFPLCLPHATEAADEYEGYHIPAKTTVLPNVFAMNHHADFYPSPQSFAPERHLDPKDPRVRLDLRGEKFPGRWEHSTFGYGKRVCMGADMAINSLEIAVSKMLWGFNVRLGKGKILDLEDWGLWTDGTMMKPRLFGVVFDMRGERVRGVIEREARDAEEYLGRYNCFE